LRVLHQWGYDKTLPFAAGKPIRMTQARRRRATAPPGRRRWRPPLSADRCAVRLGPAPIDLGGIGKGLAVRWASAELAGAGRASLVEAGGDLYASGTGPDGDGWHVAVEDPRGASTPVAVLRVSDAACATSSVRVRHWHVDGSAVHHLVDPRNGRSGGDGLLAVTVLDTDPARAEVWSKALFLTGRARLRSEADERGIAALLVDTDGVVGVSRAMRAHVLWQAPRGW
jgi:FAD:protein FMN transferase